MRDGGKWAYDEMCALNENWTRFVVCCELRNIHRFLLGRSARKMRPESEQTTSQPKIYSDYKDCDKGLKV